MKNVFLIFFTLIFFNKGLLSQNISPLGNWFECEFSISGNEPLDDCQILDDDGFLLKNNKIYHLKVKNSIEGNCRGNKVGHCFNFNIKELEVKKVLIGNIEIEKNSLKIRYLGCSQKYLIQKNSYFFKVFPDKKNCFWTKEKNYYVRKWNGKLFLN